MPTVRATVKAWQQQEQQWQYSILFPKVVTCSRTSPVIAASSLRSARVIERSEEDASVLLSSL